MCIQDSAQELKQPSAQLCVTSKHVSPGFAVRKPSACVRSARVWLIMQSTALTLFNSWFYPFVLQRERRPRHFADAVWWRHLEWLCFRCTMPWRARGLLVSAFQTCFYSANRQMSCLLLLCGACVVCCVCLQGRCWSLHDWGGCICWGLRHQ